MNFADSQIAMIRRKMNQLGKWEVVQSRDMTQKIFSEFFAANLSKTLSFLKAEKMQEFAKDLEANLDKFCPETMQGYVLIKFFAPSEILGIFCIYFIKVRSVAGEIRGLNGARSRHG